PEPRRHRGRNQLSRHQEPARRHSLGLPVINMSFGAGWTAANNWAGDYDKVGNLAAYADFTRARGDPAHSDPWTRPHLRVHPPPPLLTPDDPPLAWPATETLVSAPRCRSPAWRSAIPGPRPLRAHGAQRLGHRRRNDRHGWQKRHLLRGQFCRCGG